MPGGKYPALQNPDGTWNVGPVPLMPVHEARGRYAATGEAWSYDVDAKWLRGSVSLAEKEFKESAYMAPLHEDHRPQPGVPIPSDRNLGRMRPTGVKPYRIEGTDKPVAFGMLMHIPHAKYAEMRHGKLAGCYLSAEVNSFEKGKISSVSLMSATPPRWPFPPITIGDETPHPNAPGSDRDAIYRADPLQWDGKAQVYADISEDTMDDEKKKKDEEEKKKAAAAMDDPPETDEPTPAEQDAEDEDDDAAKKEKAAKAAKNAAGDDAAMAAQYSALRSDVDQLKAENAALKKEKRERDIRTELVGLGYADDVAEQHAAKYCETEEKAAQYMDAARAAADQAKLPPKKFTDTDPGLGSTEGLSYLNGKAQAVHSKAAQYSGHYDELCATGSYSEEGRAKFVATRLAAEGLIKNEEVPK